MTRVQENRVDQGDTLSIRVLDHDSLGPFLALDSNEEEQKTQEETQGHSSHLNVGTPTDIQNTLNHKMAKRPQLGGVLQG